MPGTECGDTAQIAKSTGTSRGNRISHLNGDRAVLLRSPGLFQKACGFGDDASLLFRRQLREHGKRKDFRRDSFG